MKSDNHGLPADRTPHARWMRYLQTGPYATLAKFLLMSGCVLLGASVLWLRHNVPPGQVGKFFPTDLIFYYYPMTEYASEQLAQGNLPLWNPHQCCGVPFLATMQVGVFYPGTWLALLMPVADALKTLMFLEVLLGGLFAAMFFRSLHMSYYAAGIGGFLFIFACILGQTFWPPQVSTICWLPFLMLCVEKFAALGRWTWWVAFTLGTALQILAGFPQFLVYTFYLLVPYALLRLAQLAIRKACTRIHAVQRCVMLGLGGALAFGLAAIQWLPTLELVDNSAREERLEPKEVHYLDQYATKSPDTKDVFRNALDPRPEWVSFDRSSRAGYLGMATLFMICTAVVFHRRNPLIWFFLLVAAVSLTLSFGYHGWSGRLYEIYGALPTGGMFRTPDRFRLLTFFSLIAIAVFGLEQFCKGFSQPRPTRAVTLAAALVVTGLLALAVVFSPPLGRLLACLSAGLLAASWILCRNRWGLLAVRTALGALLLFDLAYATGPYGSLRDIPIQWGQSFQYRHARLVDGPSFTKVARQTGYYRVCTFGMTPMKTIRPIERTYTIGDYEALLPERWFHANQAMHGNSLRTMFDVHPITFKGFYDIASVKHLIVPEGPLTKIDYRAWRQSKMARRYGLHHRVPLQAPASVRPVFRDNSDALGRAYLAGRFEVCSPDEALARVTTGNFDYHTTVLLEKEPNVAQSPDAAPCEPADIVSYAPQRVVIKTAAANDRILVLTDTYFPGWKAFVDGAETEIFRANYLFRAVRLPAGPHEVVFEYRPDSFKTGAALSGVSLGILVLLGAAGAYLDQRRRLRSKAAPDLAGPA